MPAPHITTLPVLQRQLHRAMQLEHATIPPYLTALYSIKPGTNPDAVQVLRVVVVERCCTWSWPPTSSTRSAARPA